jgi:transcription antitermination factor NusG
MLPRDISWYVVHTKPRAEALAARSLRELGYKAIYLHTTEIVPAGRTKSKIVKRSWLPGYVFVGLTPDRFVRGVPMLHKARTAEGVSQLVLSPGGYPTAVPHQVMEELTFGADPYGEVYTKAPKHRFAGKSGYRVKLGEKAGAYQSFIGLVDEVDESGRCVILIEQFGRQVRTTITPEDVDELYDLEGQPIERELTSNLKI